ncbi:ankyrin repeat and BTB (POZ) domain containing 2, partial [Aphelenchoides avenae]
MCIYAFDFSTASKELYLSTRSANSDRQSDSPHESLHRSTTSSANCRESPACTNTTFTTYSSTGSASTTSTRSPTDSGFSSTSRYVANLSPPSTPPKPPPLPPLPAKSSSQKGHTRSMVKIDPLCSDPPPKPSRASVRHEPTVLIVNGTDTLGDATKPASDGANLDSARRSELPSMAAEYPRVTSNVSLALSSTDHSKLSAAEFAVRERQGEVRCASMRGMFPLGAIDTRKILLRSLPDSDLNRISDDAFASLADAAQKPLTRAAVEFGRLSHALIKCTPNDVKIAAKLILPEAVAENCVKAGMQATSLYALSGTGALRTSMSRRAGLNAPLGRIYQWIVDSGYVAAITDPAVVFFAAVAESFVEAAARTLLAKL